MARPSQVRVEIRNSQDLGFTQCPGSGNLMGEAACSSARPTQGAWHRSQKALSRNQVGSWESSNKLSVNTASIWENFIKYLKKNPSYKPKASPTSCKDN